MVVTLFVDFVSMGSDIILVDLNIVWPANVTVTISYKDVFAVP